MKRQSNSLGSVDRLVSAAMKNPEGLLLVGAGLALMMRSVATASRSNGGRKGSSGGQSYSRENRMHGMNGMAEGARELDDPSYPWSWQEKKAEGQEFIA